MKRSEHAATAAVACPIATAGEVFADGAMIELSGVNPACPELMLWDGSTRRTAAPGGECPAVGC
jgi:hypothetical protein